MDFATVANEQPAIAQKRHYPEDPWHEATTTTTVAESCRQQPERARRACITVSLRASRAPLWSCGMSISRSLWPRLPWALRNTPCVYKDLLDAPQRSSYAVPGRDMAGCVRDSAQCIRLCILRTVPCYGPARECVGCGVGPSLPRWVGTLWAHAAPTVRWIRSRLRFQGETCQSTPRLVWLLVEVERRHYHGMRSVEVRCTLLWLQFHEHAPKAHKQQRSTLPSATSRGPNANESSPTRRPDADELLGCCRELDTSPLRHQWTDQCRPPEERKRYASLRRCLLE